MMMMMREREREGGKIYVSKELQTEIALKNSLRIAKISF